MNRLDNLCRSERYFTSALLTGLLFHENMSGTHKFLNWIIRNNNIHMVSLKEQKLAKLNPIKVIYHVEVVTELNVKRDLGYYYPEKLVQIKNDLKKGISISHLQNVPDVIIVADENLFIIEGKYYVKAQGRDKINEQLLAQKEEIQIIVQYLSPKIEQYCHIFLGPQTNLDLKEYECEAILSWEDIYNFSKELLGSNSYISERLKDSIDRFNEKELIFGSQSKKIGQNYSYKLALNDLLDRCYQEGDQILVGFHGGLKKLALSSKSYLENRKFKVDSASKGVGKKEMRNWIKGNTFLSVVNDILYGQG